ncbi:MAG: methyltransferase domain-containing protein [Alphaproteobacteria bacterium]|nr:methyltransferase domain-containing protein [Alphaproteobacteria bacterium]
MGRWSRRLARSFLDFAQTPPRARILDVGCGTGSLMLTAAARFPEAEILGLDVSSAYLAQAAANAAPNTSLHVGDAAALPWGLGTFDACLSQLVFDSLPDPGAALAEMARVTRPGGIVAATIWDVGGGMPWLRLFADTAAVVVEPEGEALRTALFRAPLAGADALADLWSDAGLNMVEQTMLAIRIEFMDFEDCWQPLAVAPGPVSAFIEALPTERRAHLKERVRRAFLAGRPDGPRSFAAAAWAVRGVVG